jgi:TRAP transporter TAXI family solute receptor
MNRLPVAAIVASALVLAAPAAKAQQSINILTGGTSGIYYPLGVALGEIYDKKIPNVKTQVQATKASVENLILLERDRGDVAFTIGDSLKAAWEGDEDAGFKAKLGRLRAVAAIYPNYIHFVATKESGIKTVNDLKGNRLSVGAPRSGTELNTRAILRAAGMSYADVRKVEYLPFAESVDLMKNRQLDATLQSAGLGVASVRNLSNAMDVTLVSMPKAIVQKMGPPFMPATIPANTYKGQDNAVETAGVANYLVTHSGVPDELVYQMTKVLFESLPELAKAHEAGKQIKLENALAGVPIPLHPGAERYYKEMGLKK